MKSDAMFMFNSILSVLPPLATGALFIITLVLKKGQICPGQRGRIHKVLPSILVVWLLAAMFVPFTLINVILIGFFLSRVKTKKTKDEGPLYILYVVNALSTLMIIYQMVMAPTWVSALVVILETLLLGLAGAHVMLTLARTRLQAFHKILPVAGVFVAMGFALVLVPFAAQLGEEQLHQLLQPILINFALLVTAIFIWVWHLIVSRKIEKLQISLASVLLFVSMVGFHQIYF